MYHFFSDVLIEAAPVAAAVLGLLCSTHPLTMWQMFSAGGMSGLQAVILAARLFLCKAMLL